MTTPAGGSMNYQSYFRNPSIKFVDQVKAWERRKQQAAKPEHQENKRRVMRLLLEHKLAEFNAQREKANG